MTAPVSALDFYGLKKPDTLTGAVDLGATGQPDTHGRVLSLQSRTGLPVDFIERNLPDVEREAARKDFDPERFRAESPALADWLTDPDHAILAGDDHGALKRIELRVRSLANAFRRGFGKGSIQEAQTPLGFKAMASVFGGAPLTAEETTRRRVLAGSMDSLATLEAEPRGAAAYVADQIGYSGRQQITSLKAMAGPALVGGAIGAAGGALGGQPGTGARIGARVGATVGLAQSAFTQEAAAAYDEYEQMTDETGQPLDRKVAAGAALGVGAVNGLLEFYGEKYFLKTMAGMGPLLGFRGLAAKDAAKAAVREALLKPTVRKALAVAGARWIGAAGVESLTEMAQEVVAIVGREGAEAASPGTFAPQPAGGDAARVADVGLQTFVGTLGVGAGVGVTRKALGSVLDGRAVRQAKETAAELIEAGAAVAEAKTPGRAADRFAALVQHQAETHGAPASAFVSAEVWTTLYQSEHQDPAVAFAEITGDTEQYADAMARGGDLVIPFATLLAKIAPNAALYEKLVPDLRIEQGGLSLREAEAQEEATAALPDAPTPTEDAPVTVTPEATFRESLTNQLVMAGRDASQAETEAAIPTAILRTLGERTGLNLFDRYQVQVGQQLAAPAVTEASAKPKKRKGLAKQSREELYAYLHDTERLMQDGPQASQWTRWDDDIQEMRSATGKGMGGSIQEQARVRADKIEAELVRRGETIDEVRANAGAFAEARAAVEQVQEQTSDDVFWQGGRDQTDSPAFRAWFGDSKVVDAEGKPLVVYHGTLSEFDAFDKGKVKDRFPMSFGMHFTSSEPEARNYARQELSDKAGSPIDGRVVPCYLSVQNPLVIETDHPAASMEADFGRAEIIAKVVESRRTATPYDGVIIRRTRGDGFDHVNVIVFAPEQIKSATGNRGTFDPASPNILFQAARKKPITATARTKAFKKWFGKSKVVDSDDNPLTVYHGTVTDFDTFDPARGNVEADFGRAIYFTNTSEDVSVNYAGLGPDITQKLERMAEQLSQEQDISMEDALAQVKAQEVEHGGAVMPVNLKIENPAILGGDDETRLTFDMGQDDDGEFTGEESGTLLDFVQGLRDAASRYDDGDVSSAIDEIMSQAMDGDITLREAVAILNADEQFGYFTDDRGDIASHEIIREAIERAGFDGIIDRTVNEKFGSERKVGRSMVGMDENTVHYIVFRPAQIKSQFNSGAYSSTDPNILRQGERGFIQISESGQEFNIRLLAGADRSTFLHETGHLWVAILQDLEEDATDEVRADLATLREWVGNDGESPFTTEQHEQIARGFEGYLLEGKAPSVALRSAFARFKSWLVALYKDLRGLNVDLTPEVRAVMDRLLASDEEIAAARAQQGFTPLTQEALGATDAEYASYTTGAERAATAEGQTLMADLMAEEHREGKAWWKAEEERTRAAVATEFEADPAWQATQYLRTGESISGADLPDAVKLNRAILVQRYGPEIVRELPRGITEENGADPDQIAGLFGYAAGDDLIPALLSKRGLKYTSEIERETRARMLAAYPGLLRDSAALAQAAQDAVHSGEQSNTLLTELKLLGRQLGQRLPPRIDQLRADARALVGRSKVRDLSPYTYQLAEATAARKAEAAGRKGDIPTAQEWKRKQLLNHLAYRIARDLRDESDKAVDFIKRYTTDKARAKFGLAGADYLEQIDGLLDRFEFRTRTLKAVDRATSLAAWITAQEEDGQFPVISDALRQEAFRTHWKNLTPDQLFDVRDAVENIVHLAGLKNRLTAVNKTRELNATALEIGTSIRENATGTAPQPFGEPTASERAQQLATAFLARHQRLGSFARIFDGQHDNGPAFRLFLTAINDAQNIEAGRLNLEGTATAKLYETAYTKQERATMGGLSPTREAIPGTTLRLTKWTRLMIALNTGTEDNRQKLLDGATEHLDESSLERVLATLDERDWTFVQAVWDQIGSYRAEIEQLHERLTGLKPTMVAPRKISTRFGEFRGGYFPIDYDADQSADAYAHQIAQQADLMKKGAAIRATTKQGFTKERVASTGRPLKLSPAVIYRHQSDVIHYLTHQEMLLDANRLLKHRDIRGAILDHYGMATYREIGQALTDLAAGSAGASGLWEKGISHIRIGASAALLGYNVVTTALQGFGLSNAIVRIGAKYVGFGVTQAWKGGPLGFRDVFASIQSRSEFMAQRVNATQRDLAEALNTMRKPGKFDAFKAGAYSLIARGQLIADVPTWLGAYQKAADDFPDSTEAERVALADQAVKDSQGGGLLVDQAGIERAGAVQKLLTTFMSYGITVLQQNVELVKRTQFSDPRQVAAFLVDGLLLNVLPVVMAGFVRAALRGDTPDPDDIGRDLIASLFNMFIVLREFAGPIQTGRYTGPAGLRIVPATVDLGTQLGQGEADEAFWKALNMEGGLLFHYPALQIQRTVQGANALLTGQTLNPTVLLGGPPRGN